MPTCRCFLVGFPSFPQNMRVQHRLSTNAGLIAHITLSKRVIYKTNVCTFVMRSNVIICGSWVPGVGKVFSFFERHPPPYMYYSNHKQRKKILKL